MWACCNEKGASGLLGVIKYLSFMATRIMVAVGGFGLKKRGGGKWSFVNFSRSTECGLKQKFLGFFAFLKFPRLGRRGRLC